MAMGLCFWGCFVPDWRLECSARRAIRRTPARGPERGEREGEGAAMPTYEQRRYAHPEGDEREGRPDGAIGQASTVLVVADEGTTGLLAALLENVAVALRGHPGGAGPAAF